MTLVDSNVLLDVVTRDPVWLTWSLAMLNQASLSGVLIINPVIYAELAPGYEQADELEELVRGLGLEVAEIPRAGLFRAGKLFQQYRRRGGVRTGVLPDFFIGAHASVAGLPLLTRDHARYATYFPEVQLIAPALK